jgi:hypothetical protein
MIGFSIHLLALTTFDCIISSRGKTRGERNQRVELFINAKPFSFYCLFRYYIAVISNKKRSILFEF